MMDYGNLSLMEIDVILNPAEIALLPERDLSSAVCVVFDVLRATSSMITGLAYGATEIHPVRTIEEAKEMAERMPHALLGGERHGDPIPGFDIGNSPFEYKNAAGRVIISTTTNGTVALKACEKAQRVLVGAVLNLNALASEIVRTPCDKLLIVCAGTFADFSLEDAWAASALISRLTADSLSDSAWATLAITRQWPTPAEAFHRAKNGRALLSKGRENEVEWCMRDSHLDVVGEMKAGVVRAL